MSYIDKINKIIDTIDPGSAKFDIFISKDHIRPKQERWTADIDEGDLYSEYINRYANRKFLPQSKKFVVDRDYAINSIQHGIIKLADVIFIKCSPAKAPRRTKLYKSFHAILWENKGKIDFVNSIFDIAEYYHSVTKSESILNENNDVHRKNIFQLLNLMEKSYVKRETNSNE